MKFWLTRLFAFITLSNLTAQTVPSLVNYQGRLLDNAGNPRSGNVSIALSVHTAATGGAQVYTETINPVPLNNGLFSLQFGGQPGFATALATPEAWLEVRVDEAQVGARSRLVAVPYAIKAATVETVVLGNVTHATPAAGTIRWTGNAFEGFTGTEWLEFSLAPPARPPLVSIGMVTVGNPGNAADPTANVQGGNNGAVEYEYRIGKYEVTNTEYCTFLNAVDPNGQNTLALYSASMGADEEIGGITFTSGNVAGAKFTVKAGFANKPVVFVNFYDAVRFCNWLHNGALAGGNTENGAYNLTSSSGTPVTRSLGATFAVPTENEWYKAAYHQPWADGGDNDHYWAYPTQGNSLPNASAPPGIAPAANYYPDDSIDPPLWPTPVGAYTTTLNFYGTFDMAGNAMEWTETIPNSPNTFRVLRGGNWESAGFIMQAQFRVESPADSKSSHIPGFRVVGL